MIEHTKPDDLCSDSGARGCRSLPFSTLWIGLLGFFLLLIRAPFVLAQGGAIWPPQQRVPGYPDDTWPPILVADQNRTVHAFSTQWLNRSAGPAVRGIVYNRWSLGQGWTVSTSILLPPFKGEARLLDAVLDPSGVAHVIFWGGDNTQAHVYYSSAPIAEAQHAQAWSRPVLAAEHAGDPENGVLYVDDQNDLAVLYSGRAAGNGVYTVSSSDRGSTWSKPAVVTFTRDSANAVGSLTISNSDSGRIHVIWNEINRGGQGRGVYYMQRAMNDSQWSLPIELAAADEGYGTNTPAIIEYHSVIYAFYNLGGIIWQRSSKDGSSWTPPMRLFSRHVGVNGALSLVVDGNDDLNMFFGQRITGSPDIHGMWHSVFQGANWSEPEAVVSGPAIADQEGSSAFDPFEARAVVVQGNVVLVAWRSDPGLKGNGVWYSYKVLDAPELPLVEPIASLPTASSNADSAVTPTSSPPTPRPNTGPTQASPATATSLVPHPDPIRLLFIASLPVVLLLSAVFGLTLLVRQNRH